MRQMDAGSRLFVQDGIDFGQTVEVPDVIDRAVVGFGFALAGGAFDGFGWIDDEQAAVVAKSESQVRDKRRKNNGARTCIDDGKLLAFITTVPTRDGVVAGKIGS